jgi:hypothetical protein
MTNKTDSRRTIKDILDASLLPERAYKSYSHVKKSNKASRRITIKDIIDAGLLPARARIIATYKRRNFVAHVMPNGKIEFDERVFSSLSGAGVAVKENVLNEDRFWPISAQVSGWDFWHYMDDHGITHPLSFFRNTYRSSRGCQ